MSSKRSDHKGKSRTEMIEALEYALANAPMRRKHFNAIAALADALKNGQPRCALRRPDETVVWETLSDPVWGASRRADGMEVFNYLVIPWEDT